jgi:hypothetical protein
MIEQEKISRGATFSGVCSNIGFLMFFGGVAGVLYAIQHNSFSLLWGSVLSLLFGGVFFIAPRGVIINYKEQLIKEYLSVAGMKIGDWKSLLTYDKIELKYVNESQAFNYKLVSNTVKTRVFNVILTCHSEQLLLKSFLDYKEAKAFLVEYADKMKKPSVDEFDMLRRK